MKQSLSILFGTVFAFVLPIVTFAQGSDSGQAGTSLAGGDSQAGGIGEAMSDILNFIDGIVIPVILSIGFLVFVWGMFKYFIQGGHSDEAQESGKSLIMYAVAGFVVILAFWGIVNLISGGIGLENDNLEDTPKANLID